ncbi:uncharacterized protein C6orf203 homolog [Cephus cinctus]|uniref:Uncharacterized protein C6orf203 homolog n=1 Tax=Cephus cinctus TaxID=211228 RepID=A0AAJ7BMW7_CEPCN|nr:uncharacterized protein C6orf203 homolog [Cephus cinctus]
MLCRRFIFNFTKYHKNLMCLRTLYLFRPEYQYLERNKQQTALSDCLFFNNHQNFSMVKRFKYNRRKSTVQERDDDDDDDEESGNDMADMPRDKSTKIISTKVASMRLDLIVKAGLSIARNKVELLFYQSRIRYNGQRVLKKSINVHVGDEVDVIKGPSPNNPKFLIVARIVILSASGAEDGIKVKLSRDKSLLIENYNDPWKVPANTALNE